MPVVASSDLAQDVVQDVFVRLWDIRHALQIRGSVAGYLYRAVRNRARDLNAHEQAQHRLASHAYSGGEEPRVMNAGEAEVEHADFTNVLDAALLTLQPRTRDIFLMRAQADMSYAEIAHELGIGIPTVRMQMYRATTALARQLSQWLDPEAEFDLGEEGTS
jgi:RNA polymerase sigma-70 factor (ECF subfamily)